MAGFDDSHAASRPILAAGETILWTGKPKKSAFVADQALTMLPIALLWMVIDIPMIIQSIHSGGVFLLGFFALHLMPVWIWLGSALTANKRWHNTTYYVTNRRILIRGGFLAVNEQTLYFKDIQDVSVKIGLLDKLFGSGDVCFNSNMLTANGKKSHGPRFVDLEDPHDVYARVQRIVLDIQTDMEYPNAYRPSDNPGYHTDYRF